MSENSSSREIGPHGWIRRGRTFEEETRATQVQMPAGSTYHQLVDLDALAVAQGPGNFCVCALAGRAFAVGCLEPSAAEQAFMQNMVKGGKIFIKSTLFSYPEFPLLYVRMFIPSAPPETETRMRGAMVECLADFTEANFQEWVVAARQSRQVLVNLRKPQGDSLATGTLQLEPSFVDDLLKDMDEADGQTRKIPQERRSFQAASGSFFKEHPEPFLFA